MLEKLESLKAMELNDYLPFFDIQYNEDPAYARVFELLNKHIHNWERLFPLYYMDLHKEIIDETIKRVQEQINGVNRSYSEDFVDSGALELILAVEYGDIDEEFWSARYHDYMVKVLIFDRIVRLCFKNTELNNRFTWLTKLTEREFRELYPEEN